jgi:hypothetical protein
MLTIKTRKALSWEVKPGERLETSMMMVGCLFADCFTHVEPVEIVLAHVTELHIPNLGANIMHTVNWCGSGGNIGTSLRIDPRYVGTASGVIDFPPLRVLPLPLLTSAGIST